MREQTIYGERLPSVYLEKDRFIRMNSRVALPLPRDPQSIYFGIGYDDTFFYRVIRMLLL